jgi:hypothetical protein
MTETHTTEPEQSTAAGGRAEPLVSRLVCAYLRWRYGGNVAALKPPLGWGKYLPRPMWYRLLYKGFLLPRWNAENALFSRFGQPMRDAWMRG